MPITTARLDEFGREVLDPKPIDVPIGRRRLTDHERFMRVLDASKYQEWYQQLQYMQDDDDYEFEDDYEPPTPVPQHFEELELQRQDRRRQEERDARRKLLLEKLGPKPTPTSLPRPQNEPELPLGPAGPEGTGPSPEAPQR